MQVSLFQSDYSRARLFEAQKEAYEEEIAISKDLESRAAS